MNIVITGGGTGIGRACAARFAADRHDVVIVGRRAHILEETASAIGPSVTPFTADVSEPAEVARLAGALDRVDVLVCAAGGLAHVDDTGDELETTARAWEATYRSNVISAVLTAEALLPKMPAPGGRIVAVSSVSGRKGAGSYGAAKAALNNWVVDLAGELAPQGITVNAVAPGYVPDTGFWDGRRDPEEVRYRLAKVAMGRPGQLAEVAESVAYFASPLAGFTTGQILGVDGGTLLAL